MGQYGPHTIFGCFWALFVSIWAHVGARSVGHTIGTPYKGIERLFFWRFFWIFGSILGPMGPKWAHMGPKRAQKGLKIVWDPFGTIWDQFGPIWAQYGPIWGPKGKLPGAFGAWEKHFRKIDPGFWDLTLNYEKIKVAPRNSVQNPGTN